MFTVSITTDRERARENTVAAGISLPRSASGFDLFSGYVPKERDMLSLASFVRVLGKFSGAVSSCAAMCLPVKRARANMTTEDEREKKERVLPRLFLRAVVETTWLRGRKTRGEPPRERAAGFGNLFSCCVFSFLSLSSYNALMFTAFVRVLLAGFCISARQARS